MLGPPKSEPVRELGIPTARHKPRTPYGAGAATASGKLWSREDDPGALLRRAGGGLGARRPDRGAAPGGFRRPDLAPAGGDAEVPGGRRHPRAVLTEELVQDLGVEQDLIGVLRVDGGPDQSEVDQPHEHG